MIINGLIKSVLVMSLFLFPARVLQDSLLPLCIYIVLLTVKLGPCEVEWKMEVMECTDGPQFTHWLVLPDNTLFEVLPFSPVEEHHALFGKIINSSSYCCQSI